LLFSLYVGNLSSFRASILPSFLPFNESQRGRSAALSFDWY